MTSQLSTVPLSPVLRPLLEESKDQKEALKEPLLAQGASTTATWLPKTLIAIDKVMDIIPFGSTANNIIDLGLKHLVIKDSDPDHSLFKDYIEHIQKKETTDCLIYGIPFIGNLVKIKDVVMGQEEPQAQITPFNLPPSPFELFEKEGDFSTIGDRLRQRDHMLDEATVSHRGYDPQIYHNFTGVTI